MHYTLKLKLKSSSYNLNLIYSCLIKRITNKYRIKTTTVNLPNYTNKITLLRSPHIYKKSKQTFKKTQYSILLTIQKMNIKQLKNIYFQIITKKPKSVNLEWNLRDINHKIN